MGTTFSQMKKSDKVEKISIKVESTSVSEQSYDTSHGLEEIPHEDLYRAMDSISGLYRARPSLPKLHEKAPFDLEDPDEMQSTKQTDNVANPVKLGWCSGVMLRGVLSIIGTMLFLRHAYIMGQAGILAGCAIIMSSTSICLVTAFSLSAIATNGEIRGGGAYFLLSRSLGPEWGASIGIILSFSNCLSCSLCVVGFAETVKSIFIEQGYRHLLSYTNDVRIISITTLMMLMIIVVASIRFETAIMYMLMVVLVISMTNFLVGSFMPTNTKRLLNGFTGYSVQTMRRNLKPKLINGSSLGQLYGIFFPSMTGVLAGVNISGNLKDPTNAIPKGTILALLFSSMVYFLSGLIYTATLLPSAPGSRGSWHLKLPEDCIMLENASYTPKLASLLTPTAVFHIESTTCIYQQVVNIDQWDCLTNNTCTAGSLHDYNIMKVVSAFPPLIYAGIFAATLSSASAAFVAGPKVFQALCRDKILPKGFKFFAVGHISNDEPHRIYALEIIINAALVLIGNLNQLAIIVAQFTMVSYVFINYAAFAMDTSGSVGWRPAFRLFHRYVSLAGAISCLISMFVVGWRSALMTFGVVFAVYIFVKISKPDINWGSSTHAQMYSTGIRNLYKFASVGGHVKHFRPQCLIMAGDPSARPDLLKIITEMSRIDQLALCANVLDSTEFDMRTAYKYRETSIRALKEMKLRLFYTQIVASDIREGLRSLIQCTGFGCCTPNIVVLGFKHDWANLQTAEDTVNYFNCIHDSFDLRMAVVIYRSGTRISDKSNSKSQVTFEAIPEVSEEGKTEENVEIEEDSVNDRLLKPHTSKIRSILRSIPKVRLPHISIKRNPIGLNNTRKSSIDVWWLYDDGGLSLLLPYILSKNKEWQNCKMRVFSICHNSDHIGNLEKQRQLAILLAKFRISYESIHVINTVNPELEADAMTKFNRGLIPFIRQRGCDSRSTLESRLITSEELISNRTKTLKQIRLRLALEEHSYDARMIFITMSVPRKSTVSAHLYMSWLEFVSRGLPPVMFIRGNQENVLTYYS